MRPRFSIRSSVRIRLQLALCKREAIRHQTEAQKLADEALAQEMAAADEVASFRTRVSNRNRRNQEQAAKVSELRKREEQHRLEAEPLEADEGGDVEEDEEEEQSTVSSGDKVDGMDYEVVAK